MSDLTERLAEALAVCDAATAGPWKYGQAARGNPADGPDHVEVKSRRGVIADLDLAPQAALDAQFISEARTGYPAALKALQAVLEIHHPSVKWYPGSNQRMELCRSDEEHWPCPTVAAITKHLGGTVEEDQQERKGSIMDYAGIWGPRPEGLDVVEWQREIRDEQ